MKKRGFTLIEVLLVVAAIAILAGIVILAINPTKQLGQTRDAQRAADVNTIINAVYQFSIDTGDVPDTILAAATEICRTDADAGGDCTGLIDLGDLVTNEEYLVDIPFDPSGSDGDDGAGYTIRVTGNGRITVAAPDAEQTTISVSR